MVDYVLNKRSGVLHRLPASESCNTDQIAYKARWTESSGVDEIVGHTELAVPIRKCRRCFGAISR